MAGYAVPFCKILKEERMAVAVNNAKRLGFAPGKDGPSGRSLWGCGFEPKISIEVGREVKRIDDKRKKKKVQPARAWAPQM